MPTAAAEASIPTPTEQNFITMHTPLDLLLFYVKAAICLLLILNIALLVSIHWGLQWTKQIASTLSDEDRKKMRRKSGMYLALLLIAVVTINGAAIVTHGEIHRSVEGIIGSRSSLVINTID